MQEAFDEAPLWETLPKETGRAYKAFCAYRDAGLTRTLVGVYRQETGRKQAGQPSGEWTGWAERNRWKERAAAYDAYLARQARQEAEAAHAAKITAYRERAAKIGKAMADVATALLVKGGTRIQALEPDTIPIGSLPAWMRTASAITRDSLAVEAEALGIHALEGMMTPDDDDSAAKD